MSEPSRRLSCRWSKRENDLLFSYPRGPDGHLLYGHMTSVADVDSLKLQAHVDRGESVVLALHASDVRGTPLVDELKRRGYDIKTLRFQVDIDASWSYVDGRWREP